MLERALDCFNDQRYPRKELVLLYEHDDAETAAFTRTLGPHRKLELTKSVLQGHWNEHASGDANAPLLVIEVRAFSKQSLGTLRNLSVRYCRGEYVCQWDDDDWYRDDRLAVQMEALHRNQKPACALSQWLMYDVARDAAYLSYYNDTGWEGSLLCRKQAIGAYADRPLREDTIVLKTLAREDKLVLIDRPEIYVYVFHDQNTWHRAHFETLIHAPVSDEQTQAIRRRLTPHLSPRTHPGIRPKVFCVGLFRTGTTSIRRALHLLGYRTNKGYWGILKDDWWGNFLPGRTHEHAAVYRTTCKNDPAVFGVIKERARHFDAFSDAPWLCLYKELDAWYPGSKFILTLRKDSRTLAESDYAYWQRRGIPAARIPARERFIERYEQHNRDVRAYFAHRPDLLEVCFERGDGWKELCAFLNTPVPGVPFPHLNKTSTERG